MSVKQSRLRLSPNEEARVIREEHEKRRKLRLIQVRELAKANAAKIREAVKEERAKQLSLLADKLKDEWELERSEKLRKLQEIHERGLHQVGEAHLGAINHDSHDEERALVAQENNRLAEERHLAALAKEKKTQDAKKEQAMRHIVARQSALSHEKERAAMIAALPPLPPDPLLNIQVPKERPIRVTDLAAFSSSHYHIPPDDYAVERAQPAEQEDAKAAAEEEQTRITELEETQRVATHEQMEKARLRHKHACQRELLKQDYHAMLHDLSDLRRSDIARRQQVVAKIPKAVFQPPQRRLEEKEEDQQDMERAFEDMYMAATDSGNLSLALDPHPLPETPAGSSALDLSLVDPGHSVTKELHEAPSDRVTQSKPAPLQDVTNLSGPSVRFQAAVKSKGNDGALRRLVDRIRSQREDWSRSMSQDSEAEVGTSPAERTKSVRMIGGTSSSGASQTITSQTSSGPTTLTQYTINSEMPSSSQNSSNLEDTANMSSEMSSMTTETGSRSTRVTLSSQSSKSATTSTSMTSSWTTSSHTMEEGTLSTVTEDRSTQEEDPGMLLHPMEMAAKARHQQHGGTNGGLSMFLEKSKLKQKEEGLLSQQELDHQRQVLERKKLELELKMAAMEKLRFEEEAELRAQQVYTQPLRHRHLVAAIEAGQEGGLRWPHSEMQQERAVLKPAIQQPSISSGPTTQPMVLPPGGDDRASKIEKYKEEALERYHRRQQELQRQQLQQPPPQQQHPLPEPLIPTQVHQTNGAIQWSEMTLSRPQSSLVQTGHVNSIQPPGVDEKHARILEYQKQALERQKQHQNLLESQESSRIEARGSESMWADPVLHGMYNMHELKQLGKFQDVDSDLMEQSSTEGQVNARTQFGEVSPMTDFETCVAPHVPSIPISTLPVAQPIYTPLPCTSVPDAGPPSFTQRSPDEQIVGDTLLMTTEQPSELSIRQAGLTEQLAEIQRQRADNLQRQQHHHEEMAEIKLRWQRELQQYNMTDLMISEHVHSKSLSQDTSHPPVQTSDTPSQGIGGQRSEVTQRSNVADESSEEAGGTVLLDQCNDYSWSTEGSRGHKKHPPTKVIKVANKSPLVPHELSTIQEIDTPATDKIGHKFAPEFQRPSYFPNTGESQDQSSRSVARSLFVNMPSCPLEDVQEHESERNWMTRSTDRDQIGHFLPSSAPLVEAPDELVPELIPKCVTAPVTLNQQPGNLQARTPWQRSTGGSVSELWQKSQSPEFHTLQSTSTTFSSLSTGPIPDESVFQPVAEGITIATQSTPVTQGIDSLSLHSSLHSISSSKNHNWGEELAQFSIKDLSVSGKSHSIKKDVFGLPRSESPILQPSNVVENVSAGFSSQRSQFLSSTPSSERAMSRTPALSSATKDNAELTPLTAISPALTDNPCFSSLNQWPLDASSRTSTGLRSQTSSHKHTPLVSLAFTQGRLSSLSQHPFGSETGTTLSQHELDDTTQTSPFVFPEGRATMPSGLVTWSLPLGTSQGTLHHTRTPASRNPPVLGALTTLDGSTNLRPKPNTTSGEHRETLSFRPLMELSRSSEGSARMPQSELRHNVAEDELNAYTALAEVSQSTERSDPPHTPSFIDTGSVSLPPNRYLRHHFTEPTSMGATAMPGSSSEQFESMTTIDTSGRLTALEISQQTKAVMMKYDLQMAESCRLREQYEQEESALLAEWHLQERAQLHGPLDTDRSEKDAEEKFMSYLENLNEETGISDEPDLTLVSIPSTRPSPEKAPVQTSTLPKSKQREALLPSNQQPGSLISFEQHERSLATMSQVSLIHPNHQDGMPLADSGQLTSKVLTSLVGAGQVVPLATFSFAGNSDVTQKDRTSFETLREDSESEGSTQLTAIEIGHIEDESELSNEGLAQQEAFEKRRNELMKKSHERQRAAKEKAKAASKPSENHRHVSKTLASWKKNLQAPASNVSGTNNLPTATGLGVNTTTTLSSADRKKLEKSMKERTERLYSCLEEVKEQKQVEQRQQDYATNRERRLEYQKKYQEQLRKKWQNK